MSTHTSWRVRQELRLDNHCSVDCSSDCSGDALAPVSTDWARPAAALSSMSQPPAASRPPAEPRLPIVLTRWHASARSRPPLYTPPAPPPLPSTPPAHTSPAQTARGQEVPVWVCPEVTPPVSGTGILIPGGHIRDQHLGRGCSPSPASPLPLPPSLAPKVHISADTTRTDRPGTLGWAGPGRTMLQCFYIELLKQYWTD